MTIPLPRVLNSSFQETKRLHPLSMSVNLDITPLSTASIQLPKAESVAARAYVEIYTSIGSVGIFRVRAPQEAYGADTISVELEHAVTEVADYLVKDSIDKMQNAATAVKTIWKHYGGSRWKLGSTAALSGDVVLSANYVTVLEALLSILDQQPTVMMDFDFSTTPWKLNFVKKGTTVTAEGRLSRNVASAQVTYDDSDLCTRVYMDGLDGTKDKVYGHLDGSTKSKYGIIEKYQSVSSDYTKAEKKKVAQAYLNDHKEPKVSISINAEDLSQITGETLDKFALGKLFRLALPEYEVTVEQHITGLSWNDVYNSPESVTVTLAQKKDTMLTFLHDVERGGGRGGASNKKETEEKAKEYWTRFTQTDEQISLVAAHADKSGKILEQAGLDLNSKGVLIYADDKKNGIMAQINTTANSIKSTVSNLKKNTESAIEQLEDEIKLRVTKKTYEAYIKVTDKAIESKVSKGNIASTINQTAQSVKISASKINLDGYVTASQLAATQADIDNLISGQTSVVSLTCGSLVVTSNSIKFGGNYLSKKTETISGTTIKYVGW